MNILGLISQLIGIKTLRLTYLTTILEKRGKETKEEIMLVFISTPSKALYN